MSALAAPTAEDAALGDFFRRMRSVNSFTDNRVNGPSADDPDVAEIHGAAFGRLTGLAGEALAARRGIGAVLWGEAGVGKSHVLSRLGRWADGRANFVYLHNLQAAPERLPRSVVRSVVSLLTCGRRDRFVGTPLFELARGGLRAAAGDPSGRVEWGRLRRAYDALIERLADRGLPLAAPIDRAIYDVLYHFFRSARRAADAKEDGSTAAWAVRWLSGDGLDPDAARTLGVPPGGGGEAAALADDEQVKQVRVALTRLAAAAGRPFILAFDQVDNLDADQFAALARFLEALIDGSSNLLAVTAGVQATVARWRQDGVVTDSAWHRLAQFEAQLLRLTAEEALAVVRARLDDFFRPLADLPAVRRVRDRDPLFPLGQAWHARWLAGRVAVRPRDVVNWAREGWRREQEAASAGAMWLDAWDGSAAAGAGGGVETITPDEVLQAIDRAVEAAVAERLAATTDRPGLLPPDADGLADLVHAALEQCMNAGGRYGLARVERLAAPRTGPPAAYDLCLTHAGAPAPLTGVLFLVTDNATSAAAALRRLVEELRPLQRLFLVTDERAPLPLGARGVEYRETLQRRAALRFVERELSFAEHAALDALQEAVRLARSGDLDVELRPGHVRPASEQEVIDSHHRRDRYRACRLLGELLAAGATAAPVSAGS
jgi:hypothetical protein